MPSNAHCRLMLNASSRSTISRRSARLSVGTRAEKIPLHCQLADLRVQVPDRRLVFRLARRSAAAEDLVQPVDGLPLPGAHLVRMDLVSGGDLLHHPVPRNASSATRFLKSAVNRRRRLVAIPVPPEGSGIHLDWLSEKAGPPQS